MKGYLPDMTWYGMVLNVSVSPITKSNKPLILIRLYLWQCFNFTFYLLYLSFVILAQVKDVKSPMVRTVWFKNVWRPV